MKLICGFNGCSLINAGFDLNYDQVHVIRWNRIDGILDRCKMAVPFLLGNYYNSAYTLQFSRRSAIQQYRDILVYMGVVHQMALRNCSDRVSGF